MTSSVYINLKIPKMYFLIRTLEKDSVQCCFKSVAKVAEHVKMDEKVVSAMVKDLVLGTYQYEIVWQSEWSVTKSSIVCLLEMVRL